MMSSTFEHTAAIALNNMAVSMMERACYRQGLETFKDAVAAMKLSAGCESPHHHQQVLGFLHSATRRVASPLLSQVRVPLNIVSHDARTCSVDAHKNVQPLRVSMTMSLVRFETDVAPPEGQDSNLAATILLYNLAVAYLCRSRNTDNASLCVRLHEGGLKILKRCRSLFAAQYETCEDPFLLPQLIYMSTVLVETLFQTLLASGDMEEAKSYVAVLHQLRAAAHSVQDRFEFVQREITTAAAA